MDWSKVYSYCERGGDPGFWAEPLNAISNGAFYWLGGRYDDPHFAEYVARAWQWGPLFVRTTMTYVVVALAVHAIAVSALAFRAERTTDR